MKKPDRHSIARQRMKLRRNLAAKLGISMGGTQFASLGWVEKDKRGRRIAIFATTGHDGYRSPALSISMQMRNALDPARAPRNTRTLADMSPEEIAALEAKYNTRVKK